LQSTESGKIDEEIGRWGDGEIRKMKRFGARNAEYGI